MVQFALGMLHARVAIPTIPEAMYVGLTWGIFAFDFLCVCVGLLRSERYPDRYPSIIYELLSDGSVRVV